MKIEECYEKMGGNYKEVSGRIPGDALILKFLGKFLDDESYTKLRECVKQRDREQAFRAAHTLKGVCANLGLSNLQKKAEEITEVLRGEAEEMPEKAAELMPGVTEAYNSTISAIHELLDK